MMIVLLLFLQKQNLANAIYLFGLGTLLSLIADIVFPHNTHLYASTYKHVRTLIHSHTYTLVHAHTFSVVHTRVPTYTHMHTRTYTYIHTR